MWQPDWQIGFRNAANYRGYCFGTILLETNDRGFRGVKKVTPTPPTGTRRLVGIGDSVTWGVGVNMQETYLHRLGQLLNSNGLWEVINAGVVGYSTWQESLFLEQYVLPLRPEVVIINYCDNDLIPTEDPFGLAQGLYLGYLQGLLHKAETEVERLQISRVMVLLQSPRFKPAYDAAPADLQDAAWELLVERPMRRMAAASRQADARLVYLIIPMAIESPEWKRRTLRWRTVLAEEGVEWLDLTAMVQDRQPRPPLSITLHQHQSPVQPAVLDRILRQRAIEKVQETGVFIDVMHPTRREHGIIAGELHRFLAGQPPSPGVEIHRRD